MRLTRLAKRRSVFVTFLVIAIVLMSALSAASLFRGSNAGSNHLVPATALGYPLVPQSSLNLIPALSPFSVSISPISTTLDVNQSVTFSVSTNVTQSYTYDWFLNGKSVGTASTYTFTPKTSEAGSNSVYVNVTSGSTQKKSNTATVTVKSDPTVKITPGSEKDNVGTKITFEATVTGGTGPFTYLWYLNGTKTTDRSRYYNLTPTGSATYYVYVVVTDNGTVNYTPTITAQSTTSVITVTQKTYQISFDETGLASGIKWYVNLTNGQSSNSETNTITFDEKNGTYTYSISSGNKIYRPSPSYGTFTVNGGAMTIFIAFNLVLYNVMFNESGLPLGDRWYVNVSGRPSLSSTSASITASLSNGSYTYGIATGEKDYYPTPDSGSLRVNGHTSSVSVTFSFYTYPVEFTETGMPANTVWSLNVVRLTPQENFNDSGSTSSPTISLDVPNGTYSFVIKSGIETFGPFPSSGNFTVSGKPLSVSVAFLRLYQITFVENGLPLPSSGGKWFMNISDPQTFSSSNDTISFWEPNQTYSYSVSTSLRWYVPLGATETGSFTVNGSSITGREIIFNELLNVSFSQSKLPGGNKWYINVTENGRAMGAYTSSGGNISFTEINGTYSYTVSSGNKLYRPSPYEGSFIPNRTAFPIGITFNLVTYRVTFSETGLTNGTFWSIIVNNNTRISINDTITFELNNGSFEYSIQGLSGFRTSTYAGNISVSGTSVVESINWTMVTYAISINQSGLAAGKHWSVTLQGKTFNGLPVLTTISTTERGVTFYEPNGTYNYTIKPPFGYTGSHVSGKVTVNGGATSVSSALVPPNYRLFGVLAGVAVGVLAVVLALMIRHERRSFFVRNERLGKDRKPKR